MGRVKQYAHTPRDGTDEWHDLQQHLEDTARVAKSYAEKFGAGDLAYAAGMVHDLGKFNPSFQQRLRDLYAGRSAERVPHAVYGALWALGHRMPMLAPVCFRHHGGLPNRAELQEILADPATQETYEKVIVGADGWGLKLEASNLPGVEDRLRVEMLLRMVFSALMDADFLDTEKHFDPDRGALRGSKLTPEDLWPVLERGQERFLGVVGLVNEVRQEVYEYCLSAAEGEPGIYRLAVPTGGGKTRSGLAFGLKHAVKEGLGRVIVAVPFLSITDQTAQTYREIFGRDAVLEHHSAVQAREASERGKLATQNWDAPLIVTTTVQLFESLLGNRPSRCRKLHRIARSVIVIDEVQTLPARLLEPILSVLRELVEHYGVTVVLSTATQPAFEVLALDGVRDIVPPDRAEEYYRRLKRVRYELPATRLGWEDVARGLKRERRVLAVLNTRADALAVLDELGGVDALHLSTLLCGAHRLDVLREVRRRMAEGEPCRLVSTQVVEAGVDLDFPTVFRAMGPLDSIVQAAGRCNREGRLEEGRVVVFELVDGTTPPGQYRTGTDEARRLLRLGADLHDPAIFEAYFERLYGGVNTDAEGIQPLRQQLDYPEVAKRFRLIEEGTQDVIVPYDWRAGRLIERIRLEGELRPGDNRRLQPYAVGLFPRDFDASAAQREEIAEGVWVWKGEYDAVRGIGMNGGRS